MSQQVQELIEKIKSEGVTAAEEKARAIEADARKQSEEIVNSAKKEAQQLILNAKEEVKKLKESTHMALKQSARDTVLSLRKTIENTLKKIVMKDVADTLSAEHLASIIEEVVKGAHGEKSGGDIVVTLNKEDLKALEDGFLARLKKAIGQSIRLQSSEDVGKGFMISFDSGKSSFDFSDENLAEYLSGFLNAQVADLVKDSVAP